MGNEIGLAQREAERMKGGLDRRPALLRIVDGGGQQPILDLIVAESFLFQRRQGGIKAHAYKTTGVYAVELPATGLDPEGLFVGSCGGVALA